MPTLKQKQVFKELSENIGMPLGEAMRRSGYKKRTSLTPKLLTKSKGWEELMEEYLPDKLLGKKHKELLTVPRKIRTIKKGEELEITEELDSNAVKAGLDMAYKLKGRYAAEKQDHTGNIIFTNLPNEIGFKNGIQISQSTERDS